MNVPLYQIIRTTQMSIVCMDAQQAIIIIIWPSNCICKKKNISN